MTLTAYELQQYEAVQRRRQAIVDGTYIPPIPADRIIEGSVTGQPPVPTRSLSPRAKACWILAWLAATVGCGIVAGWDSNPVAGVVWGLLVGLLLLAFVTSKASSQEKVLKGVGYGFLGIFGLLALIGAAGLVTGHNHRHPGGRHR